MVEAKEYDLKNYEMKLEDANRLLEPGYLPFENGYEKLSNGRIHIAVLTRMPNSKGEMVDWWFRWVKNTERYKLWHPEDHVYGEWEYEEDPDSYIGASHLVHEYVGGEMAKLKITFVEPSEYLDTSKFSELGVTAMCAEIRSLETDEKLGDMIHFIRNTDFGCEMRSQFWLESPPADYAMAKGLHQHCTEEMSTLATFLPQLYAAQKVDK